MLGHLGRKARLESHICLYLKFSAVDRVLGQGYQREIGGIQLIAQVTDPRETCAGEKKLFPVAVNLLGPDKIFYPALDGSAIVVAVREEDKKRPCRLRSGRKALAFFKRILVSRRRLPPSPVVVLDAVYPFRRSLELSFRRLSL